MKRIYIAGLGAALILLTSCGPKRLGCHGRRLCDAPEKNVNTELKEYKKDV